MHAKALNSPRLASAVDVSRAMMRENTFDERERRRRGEMFTNVVSVGLTPRIRARRRGTAVEAGRWVRWATGGGYAGVPSRRRERFLVRRTSDSSSPDVDSKEDGLDMDEIWEQEIGRAHV